MPRMPVGTTVQVTPEGGVDKGKRGVVVPPSWLPTNGRGIPDLGQGHYSPFDPEKEAVLEDDDGNIFTALWVCLRRLTDEEVLQEANSLNG